MGAHWGGGRGLTHIWVKNNMNLKFNKYYYAIILLVIFDIILRYEISIKLHDCYRILTS